jgi:beta-lactamase class A
VDPTLQARLSVVLREAPYAQLVSEGRLSVALVDLTNPDSIRFAGRDVDRMQYAASLPKIGILAGVFDQIEKGNIVYTPELRAKLELMIRKSDNATSSELIRLVGFQNIANTLQAPRHELFDPARRGGIWVGRGFGGLGLWRRDPIASTSHGATARQAARFFVLIDRGELVSPWASAEMKSILAEPAIHHKFVRGLENDRPGSVIYRKSGTWRNYHADAAMVERDGKKYVAVALLQSRGNSTQGVLASLILRLDDMIFRPAGFGTAAGEY